MIEQDSLTNL